MSIIPKPPGSGWVLIGLITLMAGPWWCRPRAAEPALGLSSGGSNRSELAGLGVKTADPLAIFARSNLVAWCIVPFDAKKRGPEERARMLDRLGLKHLAYDWRDEHIPTFDAEVEAMQAHGIAIDAWWFPADLGSTSRKILDTLERHHLRIQLWVTMGDPAPQVQDRAQKVHAAAAIIRPIAVEAARLGCTLGLYNHGGWFGEPENELAILNELALSNVGLVYNFHHGHEHINRFPALFHQMQPHLLAVNLNGMVSESAGKKILTLGKGDQELGMLRVIRDSQWRGWIGIIDHREETDSEVTLSENLQGLDQLLQQLRQSPNELSPPARKGSSSTAGGSGSIEARR